MADEPMLVVRDRWVCESLIAVGTIGRVWRAYDRDLARRVAVRIISHAFGGPDVAEQVQRRLAVAAKLEHENVAVLYDVFTEGSEVVLISELIDGPTLDELFDQRAPCPAEVVAAVGEQLSRGVAAIHTAGAVHRDLRSANVRLAYDGTVKILGLGASRLLVDDAVTPIAIDARHLSPEQLSGEARSDQRTDIYAVGLMLRELATGVRPDGLDAATAEPVGTRSDIPLLAEELPGAPQKFVEAIDRATRQDPAERWQDAQAMADALLLLCSARPKLMVQDFFGELLPPRPASVSSLARTDPTT